MPNLDEQFLRRAIALSAESVHSGDAAFGCVIVKDGKIIVEALNGYKTKITEHAEIAALNRAHALLQTMDLSGCSLYTSCEPCAMCSFMIREFKIKKVVFAIRSPYMGGYSKWPILQDAGLTTLAPIFSAPPEIVGPLLEEEAQEVMNATPLGVYFGSDKVSKK